ncbi:dihydropteroate synthase [Coprothermobacteraceae bacterium]|nr:dihydropteroate synthase [Coprothermobacteraceae bacterium]
MVRLISDDAGLTDLLERVGADPASFPIFREKAKILRIWVEDVYYAAASIIKQECLSCGADAAVHRHAITGKVDRSSVLILATRTQVRCLAQKLGRMPYWGLSDIRSQLLNLLEPIREKALILSMPSGQLELSHSMVMAIVNATPDSFFAESRVNLESALRKAKAAESEGAVFVDVGGESTRPGAEPVSADEELRRILPIVSAVKQETRLFVSVDTYKASVAKAALDAGADMINDIYGLGADEDMARVVADYGVPVAIMHMKGTPATMQSLAQYSDLMKELVEYFKERIDYALDRGVKEGQIVIDPGIGFAKLPIHNLEIMKRIDELLSLGFPVLVGHSRKSTIGKILGDVPPEERLHGTVAWTAYLAWKGVHLIRVHDVKPNVDAIKSVLAVKEGISWQ